MCLKMKKYSSTETEDGFSSKGNFLDNMSKQ